VPSYRGLKAWEHARRLAVECSKTARRLPRLEQPALAAELRMAGYAAVLRIAAASAGPAEERPRVLQEAQRSIAEIDTIICIAHDLEYLSSRDYARLEALSEKTGRILNGLLRKLQMNRDTAAISSP
jgi:four helix bundle protein